MKKKTRVITVLPIALVSCVSIGGSAGCDTDTVAQLATLSGTYIGDVVSTISTGYLLERLGAEGEAHGDEHEEEGHGHDDEPLHDHDH